MSEIEVLTTTPTYAWPVPNPDDPDDVPTDMSELAVAIENTVKTVVARPVVNGQWVKGVGGAAVWSAIAPADIPLVATTTPPASPVDGQEWVLDTGGGQAWSFRWRASTSRWIFTGGAPLTSAYDAAQGTASATAVALAGPQIVVPRAGAYIAQISTTLAQTTTTQTYDAAVLFAGAVADQMVNGSGPGWTASAAAIGTVQNLAAGPQVTTYRASSGVTVNFQNTRIWLWPLSVT